jgi:hypothetical protein
VSVMPVSQGRGEALSPTPAIVGLEIQGHSPSPSPHPATHTHTPAMV